MQNHQFDINTVIFITGTAIILFILIRTLFEKINIPSLIGYIAVGLIFRSLDSRLDFLSAGSFEIFDFLAEIGIFALLFRIGLESNIKALTGKLRSASYIWITGVTLCALAGYFTSRLVLGIPVVPSLFIAIALTATSVGVSAGVWQEAGAISTPTGELLVDLAELDDISGIVLMSVLFEIVPVLGENSSAVLFPLLLKSTALNLLRLLAFAVLCFLFYRFLEQRITSAYRNIDSRPTLMILVSGIGIATAALAGYLGLSIAIGAFFAGLMFSRDPMAIKIDSSFESIYQLFTPFFFFHIGLSMDPASLGTGTGIGLILLCAAIAGKLLGHGIPSLLPLAWPEALLIGVSMIPRSEIAMIIMQRGAGMGEGFVPGGVFSGMVLVVILTSLLSPLAVKIMLRKWPQNR